MVEAPAAFIWDYYERRKGEWSRAPVCPVYVNEIATVEHFVPGRKKCSVHAHILLAAYMNGGDTDTCFTEARICSRWRNCSTWTENVQYWSNKGKIHGYAGAALLFQAQRDNFSRACTHANVSLLVYILTRIYIKINRI